MNFFSHVKKYLWSLLFLVIQLSFFNVFHVGGVTPSLLLVLVVGYIFFSQQPSAGLFLWSGFLIDIFFYPGFGIGILTLIIIGFLFSKLVKRFLFQSHLLVFLGSIFLVTFLYHFLVWGISHGLPFLLTNISVVNLPSFVFIIGQSLYNIGIALIVFFLFNKKYLQ